MVTKAELINQMTINTRKGYLYSILKLSCVFFFIALLASYFGFTTLSTDLTTVSDNTFLAQITFIGFVITINERIIEAFKRTFRRRTSEEYANELISAKEALAKDPNNIELASTAKLWRSIVNDYSSETGRMCLVASLTVGCVLASIGAVRVFGGLESPAQFSSQLHVMLFDAVDVVLTGWVISGGSEGWTNVLYNAKKLFPQSK